MPNSKNKHTRFTALRVYCCRIGRIYRYVSLICPEIQNKFYLACKNINSNDIVYAYFIQQQADLELAN